MSMPYIYGIDIVSQVLSLPASARAALGPSVSYVLCVCYDMTYRSVFRSEPPPIAQGPEDLNFGRQGGLSTYLAS